MRDDLQDQERILQLKDVGVRHAGTLLAQSNPKPKVMSVTAKVRPHDKAMVRLVLVHTGKRIAEIVGDGLTAIREEGWDQWRNKRGFSDLTALRGMRRNVSQNVKMNVDDEYTLHLLKTDKHIPKGMVIGMIILAAWLELPPPVRGERVAA